MASETGERTGYSPIPDRPYIPVREPVAFTTEATQVPRGEPTPTENESEFTIGRMTWHKATWDDGYRAGWIAGRWVPLTLALVASLGFLVMAVHEIWQHS